jgi:N-methylhydantoinase A/oxoprolinase/acetone carboxylase beta subunit
LDAHGNTLIPLDEASVVRAVEALAALDVRAIAVCLVFAFLDPTHERRIRDLIQAMHPNLPVSLSCEVDPAFREYERTCVTAFDAYIKPVVADYLANMEQGLTEAGVTVPLQMMQSRGGLMSSSVARQRPVRLFLSGPAAGVVGGVEAARAAGFADVITVDIGGTSCDIALINDGAPLIRSEGEIDGYPVRVPMVDVTAIGSGGGSLAWIDGAGSLKFGPHSAAANPGPACYGRGGTLPTVTDASVVLGFIDPANFAGGTLQLLPERAFAAIDETIARPLGMSVEQAAIGIHRVLNAQMSEAIRLVSIGRGIDPRGYTLLPLGGGGPMHACALADDLGVTSIVVPAHPGVLSAAGLLGAPVAHEVATAFPCPLASLDSDALADALRALDERCGALMRREAVVSAEVTHFADVCYIGQSYHLQVKLRALDAVAIYQAFLAAHAQVYGHSTNVPATIVNLRTVHQAFGGTAAIHATSVAAPRQPSTRTIRLADGPVQATVWQRSGIPPDRVVSGPSIVEQADTTTLVEAGWTARVTTGDALLLERQP